MQPDGPLEALAAHFVVPAKSGVVLTKSELLVLARASEASLRINERKRMLTDVLKSAQSPGELRAMLGRLIGFCHQQVVELEELSASYPVMQPLVQSWRERATQTIASLSAVTEELELAEEGAP